MTTAKHAPPLLHGVDLVRRYGRRTTTPAVNGITVTFTAHQMHAITGPSGSGKSTLLHLLSGLDRPTSGTVTLNGRDLASLSARETSRLRSTTIGMVFQRFNLVPSLTARENIRLPLELAGRRHDTAWFDELVELLGITDRLHHTPGALSGGQQQRVAVARALLARPQVLFADEPTGSLDSDSGAELITLLRRLTDTHGTTSVIVTHDHRVTTAADTATTVVDGRLPAEPARGATSQPPASDKPSAIT